MANPKLKSRMLPSMLFNTFEIPQFQTKLKFILKLANILPPPDMTEKNMALESI